VITHTSASARSSESAAAFAAEGRQPHFEDIERSGVVDAALFTEGGDRAWRGRIRRAQRSP
jgi:hypothetical protein